MTPSNEIRNPVTNLTAEETQAFLDRVKAEKAQAASDKRKRVTPRLVGAMRARFFEKATKELGKLRKLRPLAKGDQIETVDQQIFLLEQTLIDMRMGRG